MAGLTYGGSRGGQYGGDLGGQYGYLQHGRRVDLYQPGAVGPSRSLRAVLSVDINLEHSALSDMSIELPPFEGITADAYTDGEMRYSVDGRLIFAAEIKDVSVGDDMTITLSGTSVEGQPLLHNEISEVYMEILTEDAIEEFLNTHLPYENVVHSTPKRPIQNKTVQFMDDAGGWFDTLTAGETVEDPGQLARELPQSIQKYLPPDYVPSLHPTTPIKVIDGGLTATQTNIFIEAEQSQTDSQITDSPDASGSEIIQLTDEGEEMISEFAFAHDVPKGHFDVMIRARSGDIGSAPFDRIEFSLDGQTLVSKHSSDFINYGQLFRWYQVDISYDGVLDAVNVNEGDDPHELRIEKIEGDDEIFIDCITIRDSRFPFGGSLNEEPDENDALSAPHLYPNFLPVIFDSAPVGADVSHITWAVGYDKPATLGYPGVTIPATGKTQLAGDIYDKDEVQLIENVDVPDSETVITVYGLTFIGAFDDPDRTKTPTENTEVQVVQAAKMLIDGTEASVIADSREFSGTPLSILQEMHDYADRNFTLETGVGTADGATLESFAEGDDSLVAGGSDEWIITGKSRSVTDNGNANTVHVEGAETPTIGYYRGVARDEAAIRRLDEETPDSDNGVRPVYLTDRSLTSDNDCLSRARSELASRSRMSIGGDLSIGPALPKPGYPYRLRVFDSTDIEGDIGYGLNYGRYYGVGSLGVTSSLETVGYSESAGDAGTSLSFERPSGLFRAFEAIADAELDERPHPARDDVPVVSSSSAYPSPPDDTDDTDSGGDTGGGDGGSGGDGGDGGTQDAIAYLSNDPLTNADWRVGGSAGDGTHGGHHVERPAGMPTRDEADFIVGTASGFRNALDNAGSGAIIYIDDDVSISSFDDYYLPPDLKLVGQYCDPNHPGHGPALIDTQEPPYDRRHFITRDYIELWGVRFVGPEGEYFDPRDRPGDKTDYYTSAIMTYGNNENGREGSDAFIYGCEFKNWTVAGLELGERTTPTKGHVERCTFHHNNMETLGYGVEQWNGPAEVSWCYTNDNRHDFSGFGYYTESWEIHDCMHGPRALSHAYDMHGLNQNLGPSYPNNAGDHVHVRRCTFPYTEDWRPGYESKQEGVTVRGIPEHEVQIFDNHFYHTEPPAGDGPGENGDPFRQDNISQDHFVNFEYGGNNYGERLQEGKGCPLNAPVEPQQ
jgi:hypothetical protein